MRSALGARFRNAHRADDFVRIPTAGDAWSLCVCDSYEFPFSAGLCEAGARLFGDAFAAARGRGLPLDGAVSAAIVAYRAAAERLWQDDDWGPSSATATFLAAAGEGGALQLRWIGDHAAMLVRERVALVCSEPHLLAGELAKHGVDPRDHPQATIVMRTVSATEAPEPTRATWECRPGDVLVVASGDALLPWRAAELAALVDPAILDAQLLAEAAYAASPHAFGVVVAMIAIG